MKHFFSFGYPENKSCGVSAYREFQPNHIFIDIPCLAKCRCSFFQPSFSEMGFSKPFLRQFIDAPCGIGAGLKSS
jgi:hypothetical protein